MCGRYNLITDAQALAEFFQLTRSLTVTPRYNIAPSQQAPVVRLIDGECRLEMLRWGLVPFWSEKPSTRYRMINARAETLAEKPAFRAAFRHRRCLIPATGFFEWRQHKGGKQPYNIRPTRGGLMAFAGLWEHWRSKTGDLQIDSFTIIVTDANETIRPLHDRMPVILEREHFAAWLDPDTENTRGLNELLRPAPSSAVTFFPVSRTVGNPANDTPACVEPLDADSSSGSS